MILSLCIFFVYVKNIDVVAALSSINVDNNIDRSTVILKFSSIPVYNFFSLHNPERVVVDVVYHTQINTDIFPINFNGKNLIKCIRGGMSLNQSNLRLVFDIGSNNNFYVQNIIQRQDDNFYCLVFVLTKKNHFSINEINQSTNMSCFNGKLSFANNKKKFFDDGIAIAKKPVMLILRKWSIKNFEPIVVAIDAGHGGQDPGAIGLNGLCEKNVTLAIVRKLKNRLHADKMFKPVLTRNGDYFISVMGRSEVARKQGADVLISIHADASFNKNVRGSSVWILSNRRANSEMGNWLLEQHGKRAELLGGVATLLTNKHVNPYFEEVILDLQFCYSQRVGYELGMCVLHYLRDVGVLLHKSRPESSSLGVLRSPDIPSLLIETGFISNVFEEKMLGNDYYQEKIATAIHQGLRSYFLLHPLHASVSMSNKASHNVNTNKF
ncbi:N-acetylmuramoyl-L-alanine amidase [Blochmannia endosymbiont of Camponotus (Colobopsis) obliquus]|uniref:N-acetylmuramoyl-L-alanine amidase n=1 Tax=Blochmannia endosymbiont of Camponotus (Colobopsis) obliquus TaxID=1505597 RepID=UPI00061A7A6F|nr:N-acetylmuramoyl-L-alanine amidase [Blochmannia endosymbiont of Camponotus (Colobopsis) obliquus]AKC60257.1 N-acetylmuramoyl-L-alanine amidase AmiB [Blochmannia endosymbiont of Camponotus (Colobopsis) obliquus]